ncbi:hypothetical protein [Deinococcus ruber]|uniref:Uncharacterized protein n=1 Tax=Deinococcus ruber TaxID=1848197 RepID=A0A918F8S3_9DEIO|nr:hypothetical protein [Deinococcus ruber]GGR19937.1 hypothetical protein GCM10008957_35410 [Deinococcus ruber]
MTEPLVLVDVFTLALQAVDGSAASRPARTARLAYAPGFDGTRLYRLHCAVFLDAAQQHVNIAPCESADNWKVATAQWRGREEQRGHAPQLVSITPNPATLASDGQFFGQSTQPAERNL